MDIFAGWENHTELLHDAWTRLVQPEDTVVLAGDISWGMTLSEALPDFRFLDSLPGQKLLMKGNHDYWWETCSKMAAFLAANEVTTLRFLFNNAYRFGDVAVAGTKGWFFDSGAEDEEKALNRELCRLRLSLEKAAALGGEPLAFLHYPPISRKAVCEEIVAVLHEFGVRRCYYAHLHGVSIKNAYIGDYEGIRFDLISGDSLGFCPKLIEKA